MVVRVACVGEAMVELSRSTSDPRSARLGFAGDTLNTAIYLAREGGEGVAVDFVTRLGRDGFSDDMLTFIAAEGVGTEFIGRSETRTVGLYAITTDAWGERSFAYWRDTSAARGLFSEGDPELDALTAFDVIYFSAITLAILPEAVRLAFLDWLSSFRSQGGRVAFDSNYRPRLWDAPATARRDIAAAWALTDIALPSIDDEIAVFGDTSPQAVIERLAMAGVRDGALKRGPEGPASLGAPVEGAIYDPAERVVDTTAAGDSFNGGYLAAKLCEKGQAAALRAGHDLAAQVVGAPGAILPRD